MGKFKFGSLIGRGIRMLAERASPLAGSGIGGEIGAQIGKASSFLRNSHKVVSIITEREQRDSSTDTVA